MLSVLVYGVDEARADDQDEASARHARRASRALAAVKTIGKLGAIQIVGFDNISAVNQAIAAGEILATADQHADKLAAYGIDYALALLADEKAILADRETPVDLVTAKDI